MDKVIINPLFNTKQIITLGTNPGANVSPDTGTVYYWLTLESSKLYANYRVSGESEDRKYEITDPDSYYNVDLTGKVNSPITWDNTTYSIGYSDGTDSYDLLLDGLVTGMSLSGDILSVTMTDANDNFTIDLKLSDKVDKVQGYGLSKNDFTDALLSKLNGIEASANNYSLPTASTSRKGGIKVGNYLYMSEQLLNGYEIVSGNGISVVSDTTNHNFTVSVNLAYNSAKTYSTGEIVTSGNKLYVSLADSNTNNTPSSSSEYWRELYTAGNGISISSDNAISIDSTVVALKTDKLQGKINVVKDTVVNDTPTTESISGIEGVYFPNATVSKDNSTNVATITIPSAIQTVIVNNTAVTITNRTLALTIPTKVSDITNDTGFTTKGFETPIDVIVDATNITTPSSSSKVTPFIQRNNVTNKYELALKKSDGNVETISGGSGGSGSGLTFRDDYAVDTAYDENDAVRYGGAIWRCKDTVINVAPPTVDAYEAGTATSTQLAYWGLILKDGYSAYKVWLEAGNTGTVSDFLNDLRGNSAFVTFTNSDLTNKTVTIDAVNAVVCIVDNQNIQWQIPQGSVVYSSGQAEIDISGIMAMKNISAISGVWKVGLAGGVSSLTGSGNDGSNAYLYVAYASDSTGTGFSLTPTNSLKYRAELQTTVAIANPTSTDFAGCTWVKYLGDTNYHYIAYASDNQGSDFSTTPSASLTYRAEFLSSTYIANPTLSDFSGATWVEFSTGVQTNKFNVATQVLDSTAISNLDTPTTGNVVPFIRMNSSNLYEIAVKKSNGTVETVSGAGSGSAVEGNTVTINFGTRFDTDSSTSIVYGTRF